MQRIVKTLEFGAGSQAIAIGDLNGDGLDDVVWADESTHRIRILFQTPAGDFEELETAREPAFVNHTTSLRLADLDGDGHRTSCSCTSTSPGTRRGRAGSVSFEAFAR